MEGIICSSQCIRVPAVSAFYNAFYSAFYSHLHIYEGKASHSCTHNVSEHCIFFSFNPIQRLNVLVLLFVIVLIKRKRNEDFRVIETTSSDAWRLVGMYI